MEHQLHALEVRKTASKVEYDGDSLYLTEIVDSTPLDNSTRLYECTCSDEQMTEEEAIQHLESAYVTVSAETFENVARGLYRGEQIPAGTRVNGFVFEPSLGTKAAVGMERGGGYLIALMKKGTETRGTNEPRMKTRREDYVRVKFYETPLCDNVNEYEEAVDCVKEEGTKVETGYINGYRTTPLSDALDELFKWG